MMKKWTSLAVLGLTSASLLVACGSKKEENKSSTKEAQTTVKSSQKKAKAASGKKETKATETASQEGAQAASQDAGNQVKPLQDLLQQALTRPQISSTNGARRAGRDLDRNN